MAFTTQTFLFLFFPVCLSLFYTTVWMERKGFASSFLKKIRASDLVLLLFGCVFYMWACFDDLFRFALYILIIYLLAVLIQYTRKYKFCVISEQERADEVHHHLNAALPFLFVSILFVF